MVSKTPVSRSILVESVQCATTQVCEQILSELEANDFSKEDVFAVHLALEEAFLNALKHGNRMDSGKAIKIDYSVGPDKVEISVTDEGAGFDPENVPDPRHGRNLFKAEGRGILLMRSYMDVVRFNEGGNCVHMVRYKEKPRVTKAEEQAQG